MGRICAASNIATRRGCATGWRCTRASARTARAGSAGSSTGSPSHRGRVLELGPGPGRLWVENADHLPAGLRLTLADLSPGMAREARGALRALSLGPGAPRLAALGADAGALPFADAAFDVVIANHMLYHIPDRARALAEIRRVLVPGGRLHAATNGAGHMGELDALLGGARWGDELAFSLENGGAQLSAVFAQVALARYDDALVVTEAAPLLAYARSVAPDGALDPDRLADVVAARLAADGAIRIAADGAIRIAKETGLFSAS